MSSWVAYDSALDERVTNAPPSEASYRQTAEGVSVMRVIVRDCETSSHTLIMTNATPKV